MQRRLFVLPFLALVAALLTPALSVSAQADPVAIVQHFVDARNRADESGAMALVADELSYVGGSDCPVANPCLGRQAMLADLHLFISDHAQSALIGYPSISGTTITARAEMSNDAIRAAGLDRVVYDYTLDVRDGKLTRFHAVQDASDPQTATFQALQRIQQRAGLDMSLRTHDDWPLAGVASKSAVDMSLRSRDDWPLAGIAATTSINVSPRTHDDWPLARVTWPASADVSLQSHDDWPLHASLP